MKMKRTFHKIPLVSLTALVTLLIVTFFIPYASAQAAEDEPECWGVFIGLSNYLYSDINPPLYYSDEDALDFSEALSAAWGSDHMRILIDSQATKTNILAAIDWLATNTGPNDLVVFTYSGHGVAGGYLTTYETHSYATTISAAELADAFDPVNAGKIFILLENCYAGAFEDALSGSGRVILMASEAYEPGLVVYALEHFVYGYFVIEAFDIFNNSHSSNVDTNQDYELSAEEIAAYARAKTIQYMQINYPEYLFHPVLYDGYPGDLALIAKFIFGLNVNLPFGTNILTIDGVSYTSVPSYLLWIPGLNHTLIIPQMVAAGNATRYVFTTWDDGDTATTKVISKGYYVANYNKEYLLSIDSVYGTLTGGGWYVDGTTAIFSVTPFIYLPDTKHIFTSWSGDFTGTSPTGSFTMDAPKTVTANWRSEYLLTLNSEYGTPTGAGWYNEGETVNISVTPEQGFLVRQIFDGWTGDIATTASSTDFAMDSPKVITARWHTDYMQLFILIVVILVVAGIVITIIIIRRKSTGPPLPPA
jgi:hypothetical protein